MVLQCSAGSNLLQRTGPSQLQCAPRFTPRQPVHTLKRRGKALVANAVPVCTLAAAEGLARLLQPTADYYSAQNYPDWLVHWGHPGNMAVVLVAMGGYGAAYLGWSIRTSQDKALIAKAKDMHPKLAAAMFGFFALGAVGGIMSLLMQGKPIFESPHAVTGLTGLGLLSVQALLPLFFSESGARTAHAFLGTGILGLFALHSVLGLQLGLSI